MSLASVKKMVREKIIEPVSLKAVLDVVNQDALLKNVWDRSFEVVSDFQDHFAVKETNPEVEQRIRLLIVAEVVFIKKTIERLLIKNEKVSYADVGDSDGSVQMILKKFFTDHQLDMVGINLQEQAVNKMKEKGLNAICEDALLLKDKGFEFDAVSVFETLEHLPDPIGFLRGMKSTVKSNLIISVPYVRQSRTGLYYLTNKWAKDRVPTIENTHIFELSPFDWKKIFLHSGWKVDYEERLLMFPSSKISRLILEPYWRYESFEGFWFVSLSHCEKYSSKYCIE